MRGRCLLCVICGAENQVSEHTVRCVEVQTAHTLEMVTAAQAGGELRRPAEGGGGLMLPDRFTSEVWVRVRIYEFSILRDLLVVLEP